MRRFILLSIGILLLFGTTIPAQAQVRDTAAILRTYTTRDSLMRVVTQKELVFAEDTSVVHNIGWVRSHILDNWYVQMQLGPQIYMGQEDSKGPFMDRISLNGQFNIGRWIFPMVGFRVGLGYGYAHGFLSKDTYNNHGRDNVIQGWAQCGTDENGVNYGGYYYSYNDDLLMQNWKYYYFNPDIIVNLSYRNLYNPNKTFMTLLYAGVGLYFSLSNNFDGLWYTPSGGVEHATVAASVDPNRGPEAHIGIIEQFQFKNHLSVYVDARLMAMDRTFDREWVQGTESPLGIADPVAQINFGVQYSFNLRKEETRRVWYREKIDTTFSGDVAPQMVLAMQNFSFKVVDVVDSLIKYKDVDENTPGIGSAVKRAAKRMLADTLDALKAEFEKNGRAATLDDIFSKHMLPYEMVFFIKDRWDILSTEDLKIERMAAIINAYPDQKFYLIGSADSKTGTVKRNKELSKNRADVVFNSLVIDYDVNPRQLERVYLGGILDYDPYELNRTCVIIMAHDKVMSEFKKLRDDGKAGGRKINF